VADRLEISPAQREALELGALLHDIGEIRTPEAVLQKPAPLTAEERRLVAQHPASGVDILETVPILTPALDVVGAHHERYDGGGYPNGLPVEAIPLTARIFAVVDALDAMTQDRPYRSARPLAEALEELGGRREAVRPAGRGRGDGDSGERWADFSAAPRSARRPRCMRDARASETH
jgi:HD-GYP domain-containing protein (c-di-GMP phosphodiesterase class II)